MKHKFMSERNILKIAKKIIKEHPEYFEALVEFERTGRLPKIKRRKNKEKSKYLY